MLQVMRKFKAGCYNTLISTCVGEEGLDIGEVDLIICFDAHKSPVRLVQRMGRTGRQREGRIVMLVTEGKEHAVRVVNMDSRKKPNCSISLTYRN
jgi:Fanconi anemia group M protein